MAIARAGGAGGAIRITVRNAGEQPVLVTLGDLIGSRFYHLRFVLAVTADGQERRAPYMGGPGVVAGRVDPLVVPLVPGASYRVDVPLASFGGVAARGRMRVELEVRKPACPLYGYPNPNMIPCWEGRAVSNEIVAGAG